MAGNAPNDAQGENGAPRPRSPRRKARRGPTAFQRVRQAVVRGTGVTLSQEEVADLYWRGGLARLALEDDNEKRPASAVPQDDGKRPERAAAVMQEAEDLGLLQRSDS